MKAIYQVGGETIFLDPGPEMIPVFEALDQSYRIEFIRPMPGFIPKFQRLRQKRMKTDKPLMEMTVEELRAAHAGKHGVKAAGQYECSALDVLHALSCAVMRECRLCGWQCGISRYQEASPRCRLTVPATYS